MLHIHRMTKMKKTIPSVDKIMEQPKYFYIVGERVNWFKHYGKLSVSTEVEHSIAYEAATPCLFIYPIEMNSNVHWKTRTRMFIAALLRVAKNRKPPNAHPEEWIRTLWYTHTMEYDTIRRINELPLHKTTRWISQTKCWGEESIHRSSCIVWFHLHQVQEQANLIHGVRNPG